MGFAAVADDTPLPVERRNLITLQDAADLCGVDYDTVLKWCRAGALPYVEVGPTSIKRVYRRDAERMIRKPRATPANPAGPANPALGK